MKRYIIANWKMNPQSLAEAEELLASMDEQLAAGPEQTERSIVICPPFVFLEDVGRMLKTSRLGGYAELGSQDIALADSGAWTGEISGPMLRRLGVSYVIIGHSERRWKLGESDEMVNKKLKTSLANELTPIVCIGERERNPGFKDFITRQIAATFDGISQEQRSRCLVAYEPVWAISTNPGARPDRPEDTLESISAIREALGQETRILYGGSVNSKNAGDFLSLQELAGVLVGSASVDKEEFAKIIGPARSLIESS